MKIINFHVILLLLDQIFFNVTKVTFTENISNDENK